MDAYDIIIQGGQSNAEGSGIGPVKEKYLPSEDILYLDVEKTVQAPPEGVIVTYIDIFCTKKHTKKLMILLISFFIF